MVCVWVGLCLIELWFGDFAAFWWCYFWCSLWWFSCKVWLPEFGFRWNFFAYGGF